MAGPYCIWSLPIRLLWLRFFPGLAGEWLNPVDIARYREAELNHLNQESYQDGITPHRAPEYATNQRDPPQDHNAPQRAPHDSPAQYGTTDHHRDPPHIEYLPFVDAIQDEPPVLHSPPWRITIYSSHPNGLEYGCLGNSKELNHASRQVKSSQHWYNRVKSYWADMVSELVLSSGKSYDNQYLLKLFLTLDFGLYKNLGSSILGNYPHAMKASMTHYPDTPWFHEVISG